MKIYRLSADVENYKWFNRVHSEDDNYNYEFELLQDMWGQSVKENWKPIEVEPIIESKKDALLPVGDFPNFTIPLISEKAIDILFLYMKNDVELLDMIFTGEPLEQKYYLLNVIKILDCIDSNKSKIEYFESSGRIMEIKEYTFKEGSLDDSFIFRIKGYEKGVYVNQDFKELVEKNKLQGLIFKDTSEKYRNPFLDLIK